MHSKNTGRGPILIGGPARSGKTLLTRVINRANGPVKALPIEGLFTVFLYRKYLLFSRQQKGILKDYLSRTRPLDEKRQKMSKPIDFFQTSLEEIQRKVPPDIKHQIQLLDYSLNIFSNDNNSETWAACDLHPEFDFKSFCRYVPNIKLVIMIRNPVETVCANLYQGSYPERPKKDRGVLQKMLLMWCLSAQTALMYREKYPESVHILRFNNLLQNTGPDPEEMGKIFDIPKESYSQAVDHQQCLFTYKDNNFFSPTHRWEELLRHDEIKLIYYMSGPYLKSLGIVSACLVPQVNYPQSYGAYVLFAKILLKLARFSPVMGKLLSDTLMYDRMKFFNRRKAILRFFLTSHIKALGLWK